MVADVIRGVEDVEDGGEDGEGEARAVVGGGGYGGGEVLGDLWEEFVVVGGLADEVDEEVVGCCEFWWRAVQLLLRRQEMLGDCTFLGRAVQYRAGCNELLERFIFLTLL